MTHSNSILLLLEKVIYNFNSERVTFFSSRHFPKYLHQESFFFIEYIILQSVSIQSVKGINSLLCSFVMFSMFIILLRNHFKFYCITNRQTGCYYSSNWFYVYNVAEVDVVALISYVSNDFNIVDIIL